MGIKPRSLHQADNTHVTGVGYVSVPFQWSVKTAAGTSTYDWTNDTRYTARVRRASGYMTGAGAASDTIAIQRVVAGSASAISDTADVSVLSDTDHFTFGQISDATNEIAPGQSLRVATASDALANVCVEMEWKE